MSGFFAMINHPRLVVAKLLFKLLLITAVLLSTACSMLPANNTVAADGIRLVDEPIKDNRSARSELANALSALEQGNPVLADTAFQLMMEQGAKSPEALNHYAIFLREQWRLEEAEKVYKTALKYSPNNAMTHWNIAILYEMYRGDYSQAVKHYQAYQQGVIEPDKRVAGWIIDLHNRLAQQKDS